jgi:glucose/arabinose dehydrogenase
MTTGTNLPESYRSGAFVSEHGSWDRSPLNGYKVVFVPFSGGKPSGQAQDVVTGFLDANSQARGRPVGLAVDRSGGLLIADDLANVVWRVSSKPSEQRQDAAESK